MGNSNNWCYSESLLFPPPTTRETPCYKLSSEKKKKKKSFYLCVSVTIFAPKVIIRLLTVTIFISQHYGTLHL